MKVTPQDRRAGVCAEQQAECERAAVEVSVVDIGGRGCLAEGRRSQPNDKKDSCSESPSLCLC